MESLRPKPFTPLLGRHLIGDTAGEKKSVARRSTGLDNSS
jgi:hypothetical protein